MGTVEVETAESVNHLEAMAQWAHLGRARAPFHLYVPAGSVDIAKRLATENGVNVSEIWSFHTIGDQTRFTLVHRGSRRRTAAVARRRGASARGQTVADENRKKDDEACGAQDRRPRCQKQARRTKNGRALTEEEVGPALPQVQPRQARIREHLRHS